MLHIKKARYKKSLKKGIWKKPTSKQLKMHSKKQKLKIKPSGRQKMKEWDIKLTKKINYRKRLQIVRTLLFQLGPTNREKEKEKDSGNIFVCG